MDNGIRIDKWLWAVRLFKTRSLATDFCKKGKVLINDQPVKPSRNVQIGDLIQIKKPPITYTYKVIGLLAKRAAAQIAKENVEDLTPAEEINKIKELQESFFFARDRGAGRPTKKERRDLDKFQS